MSSEQDALAWWCRLVLRGLAASFAVVGSLFFLFPDGTIHALNAAGAALGDFTPAPPSALRFWLSLGTGYMVLVTALAWTAQRDLHRHRALIALLALGKATSSLTCLAYYFFTTDAFVYLANFAVDGSIALVAVVIWSLVPRLGPPPDGAVAWTAPPRTAAEHPAMPALLEAMVPAGGAFAAGARDLGGDIERFVAQAGPGAPRLLRLGLALLDLSPWFLPPLRARRFSRLSLAERVRVLEAWEGSRLMPRRQLMHALKVLVMLHAYSRPEVEAALGYPHPLARVPREVA